MPRTSQAVSYIDKNLEVTSSNFQKLENDCSIQMAARSNGEIMSSQMIHFQNELWQY